MFGFESWFELYVVLMIEFNIGILVCYVVSWFVRLEVSSVVWMRLNCLVWMREWRCVVWLMVVFFWIWICLMLWSFVEKLFCLLWRVVIVVLMLCLCILFVLLSRDCLVLFWVSELMIVSTLIFFWWCLSEFVVMFDVFGFLCGGIIVIELDRGIGDDLEGCEVFVWCFWIVVGIGVVFFDHCCGGCNGVYLDWIFDFFLVD